MANKHLHKYRLKNLTRDRKKDPYFVYICIKQDCSHHIRVEMSDGKQSECNRCGYPFIMKLAKLKHGDSRVMVRPHCDDCTRTPEKLKKRRDKIEGSIDELMRSILPEGL